MLTPILFLNTPYKYYLFLKKTQVKNYIDNTMQNEILKKEITNSLEKNEKLISTLTDIDANAFRNINLFKQEMIKNTLNESKDIISSKINNFKNFTQNFNLPNQNSLEINNQLENIIQIKEVNNVITSDIINHINNKISLLNNLSQMNLVDNSNVFWDYVHIIQSINPQIGLF